MPIVLLCSCHYWSDSMGQHKVTRIIESDHALVALGIPGTISKLSHLPPKGVCDRKCLSTPPQSLHCLQSGFSLVCPLKVPSLQ